MPEFCVIDFKRQIIIIIAAIITAILIFYNDKKGREK
jgi:hypothetical protein